ncbi:DNA-directed RNA polymerase subunit beta' [Gossypium australe]|uniref:DNA-directed RNA polymerase subunit beta n=1 Tax=Gossypium australe TaxID=47621 RepID=A0A5B6VIF5_9ROSI|nr:DNA-directed RNA polymerase subunit beta' [Gossypium australe]
MGTEETKDPLKGVDWKAIGSELQKDSSAGGKSVVKKRLPKKIRQIPDCYFLPRMSTPSTLAFFGACIAGGIGAGILLERMEVWYGSSASSVSHNLTTSLFAIGFWQVVLHIIKRRRSYLFLGEFQMSHFGNVHL